MTPRESSADTIAPAVSGGPSFSIPAGLLKEAINEVVFAAAPDDTRPVLAGVLLKMGGGSLTLAAADGFRLAVRTVELPEAGPDLQMIVPAKTLSEVEIFSKNESKLALRLLNSLNTLNSRLGNSARVNFCDKWCDI